MERTPDNILTASEWSELHRLVDALTERDKPLGGWAPSKMTKYEARHVSYPAYGPELSSAIQFIYGTEIVGWSCAPWSDVEERLMQDDPTSLRAASLSETLRCISYMIRADRFNEGILLDYAERGFLLAAFRRLADFEPSDS